MNKKRVKKKGKKGCILDKGENIEKKRKQEGEVWK